MPSLLLRHDKEQTIGLYRKVEFDGLARSAIASPGGKLSSAARLMRNGEGFQLRIPFVKKVQLERLYILICPRLMSESVAIPHPPLRGTFPPGEGISPPNSNLQHYGTILSGSGWKRLQTTFDTTWLSALPTNFQFVCQLGKIDK